ncbi:MAG TPA: hypothetical protein VL691_23175, partial [Vicinamibacteria bacterium]|nr:hypothetical protein [Vicinamibacteria bacterium]
MKLPATTLGTCLGLTFAWAAWAGEAPAAPQAETTAAAAVAQQSEEADQAKVPRLHEEITVTASKTPQPRKDVTQAVRVIDEQAIADLPASPNRNLSELLSYQPGIFVSALSRNDANWGSNGGM